MLNDLANALRLALIICVTGALVYLYDRATMRIPANPLMYIEHVHQSQTVRMADGSTQTMDVETSKPSHPGYQSM